MTIWFRSFTVGCAYRVPRQRIGSLAQRSTYPQEDTLLRSHPARRRLIAVLGVLAVAIALPALGASLGQARSAHAAAGATGATGPTVATDDPNNYTCDGHIERGVAESGVSGTQVEYQFSCDGPITGYQIETEPHQVQYFDQSPLVALAGVPSTADSFSCGGFIPGVQINCTGLTSAAFEVITGQFVIAGKNLCTEPRVDPILTVTDATATATIGGTKTAPTATATVTQFISGPYDLGRPWGCKGDSFGADTRLGNYPPKIVLSGPPPSKKK
jgi:hypothetical protein